jgi:hypothetical protein
MKLELEGSGDLLASLLVMITFIQKSINTKTPIKLDITVNSDETLNILYRDGKERENIVDMQLYKNVDLSKGLYKLHL